MAGFSGGGIATDRLDHRVLVVADQVDGGNALDRRPGSQVGNDAGAVRPAIDVVAEVDQHRLGRWAAVQVAADGGVQRDQPLRQAVHVADGVNPPAWRHGSGGFLECDHGTTN